jgi:hypothetical protein
MGRAPAARPPGALWRLPDAAQPPAWGDHPNVAPTGRGGTGDQDGSTSLEVGTDAEARLCPGHGTLPVVSARGAADHRRHHPGGGDPHDSPASEARWSHPPWLQRVSARKPWRGPRPDRTSCVTNPSPPAALGKGHAAVSCSACRLPAYGAWVERHGCAAAAFPQRASQLPVCPLLCHGRVLHARTPLATTRHALPSGGPASIASACARALTTVPACVCISLSPHLRVCQRVATVP